MSNPSKYKEYQSWLKEYKALLKKRKSKNVVVQLTSDIIEQTGILMTTSINLEPLSSVVVSSV